MTTAAGQTKDGLSFGPFHLVASERLLTKEGAPVELGSRALDILTVLISTPNEIVSKKDLMSRVWPDAIVEEGSLRFHMASLRRALGDGKDGARYITTLPGRGYCFVAPVSRPSSPRDDAPVDAANFPHANLPGRLSRMVGRDDDVIKLSAQLNASRFVTIVGAGGIGKTTVAVAVGHHLMEAFAGAVLFVDLGMLGDPDLVATAVASMLGLSVRLHASSRQHRSSTFWQRVAKRFGSKASISTDWMRLPVRRKTQGLRRRLSRRSRPLSCLWSARWQVARV